MNIVLPKPKPFGNKSLEECIYERESVRNYLDLEINLEKLSQILWACQGVKKNKRTVPSAGATYPLEIYVLLKGKGLYLYNNKGHLLEFLFNDDIPIKLSRAAWDQDFISQTYLNIIICADYKRTTNRYGERGIRYVHIEVGHCAQNIHLEAVAMGLSSVPVGAFDDKQVRNVLQLPTQLVPLYIIPISYSRK
ncbi:MAG: SagB/ThcOx family dehydrogenase [Candidatus Thorarchaeota archaeon]